MSTAPYCAHKLTTLYFSALYCWFTTINIIDLHMVNLMTHRKDIVNKIKLAHRKIAFRMCTDKLLDAGNVLPV